MAISKSSMYSIALLVILSVSACSNRAAEANNTSIVTADSIKIPTIVPKSTSTSIPLPTKIKPTPMPLPPIKTHCVGNSQENKRLDLSDVVAFEQKGKSLDLDFSFFLLDLKNRNTVKTVDDGIFIQISPDRKHFIRILDSSGATVSDFHFSIEERPQSFFNWQNAEQLRMIQQSQDSNVVVQLFNAFTQEPYTAAYRLG